MMYIIGCFSLFPVFRYIYVVERNTPEEKKITERQTPLLVKENEPITYFKQVYLCLINLHIHTSFEKNIFKHMSPL